MFEMEDTVYWIKYVNFKLLMYNAITKQAARIFN
jgi:hypothetical protein